MQLRERGVTPAIVLINPKYIRNLASVRRAAACFGINQVWYTGERADKDALQYDRIPRELRMKSYDVKLIQDNTPLFKFDNCVPVAVEVGDYEPLPDFVHPPNAVYIFGPEDGGLRRVTTKLCHRFVTIPSYNCLNLAMAVNIVLYDRMSKGV